MLFRSGENPDCIGGDDCGVAEPLLDEDVKGEDIMSTSDTEDAILEEVINAGLLGDKKVNLSEEEFADVISGKMTADNLRKMLKEAGMEESILAGMSDEVLMQSYLEILSESE